LEIEGERSVTIVMATIIIATSAILRAQTTADWRFSKDGVAVSHALQSSRAILVFGTATGAHLF